MGGRRRRARRCAAHRGPRSRATPVAGSSPPRCAPTWRCSPSSGSDRRWRTSSCGWWDATTRRRSGGMTGFGPLFGKELREQWRTRRLLVVGGRLPRLRHRVGPARALHAGARAGAGGRPVPAHCASPHAGRCGGPVPEEHRSDRHPRRRPAGDGERGDREGAGHRGAHPVEAGVARRLPRREAARDRDDARHRGRARRHRCLRLHRHPVRDAVRRRLDRDGRPRAAVPRGLRGDHVSRQRPLRVADRRRRVRCRRPRAHRARRRRPEPRPLHPRRAELGRRGGRDRARRTGAADDGDRNLILVALAAGAAWLAFRRQEL